MSSSLTATSGLDRVYVEVTDNEPCDHEFKLLVIGDKAVGKTGLILRLAFDIFRTNDRTTIGVDFCESQKTRCVKLDGKTINLQIWDTAGQERYRAITRAYYRGAHGVVFVYDITDECSFDNVKQWMEEVEKYADENVNKILIGTKCDIFDRRAVEKDAAEKFADELGIPFFETSAKSNTNVKKAFMALASKIKARVDPPASTALRSEQISAFSSSATRIKLHKRVRNSGRCSC